MPFATFCKCATSSTVDGTGQPTLRTDSTCHMHSSPELRTQALWTACRHSPCAHVPRACLTCLSAKSRFVHALGTFACMQVTHLSAQRQELLRREYMTPVDGAPAQPPHGFKGQLHACWTHKLSDVDARAIVEGGWRGGVHGAGSVIIVFGNGHAAHGAAAVWLYKPSGCAAR